MYRLLRQIEDAAGPLFAPGDEPPRVSLFREPERDGREVCCAVLGDPGFSLLAGFGASEEGALLALLKEVRETRVESVYADAPRHVSQTAHALSERLASNDGPRDSARAAGMLAVARRLRRRTG